MHRAARRNRDAIWTRWLAIRIKNCDSDMGILLGGVQHADRFMAGELRLRPIAVCRNISFGDGPPRMTDRHHGSLLFLRQRSTIVHIPTSGASAIRSTAGEE